eukprot:363941-Chlamydomonas_euryale.AAC.21
MAPPHAGAAKAISKEKCRQPVSSRSRQTNEHLQTPQRAATAERTGRSSRFLLRLGHLLAARLPRLAQLLQRLLLLVVHLELLLLLDLDHVAVRVDRLLLLLELHLLLVGAAGKLARARQPAVSHAPRLRADGTGKLNVMRDHDDAAAKRLDGLSKSAQRVTVQVVGRLVQHQHVGIVPHRGAQHHLHLLAARQAAHERVRRELRLEAKLLEVLGDVDGRERLGKQASLRRLLRIELIAQLLKAQADQLVA